MADENDWKPGDHEAVILRKILTRLANLTVSGGGGGGGGGAVTVADGADVAQGAKADSAITNPALSATEISLLKGVLTRLDVALSTRAADASVSSLGTTVDSTADASTIGGTPATSASIVALLKGILVPTGESGDSAITNPATATTIIAALKGLLTRFDVAASTLATQTTLADNKNVGGISTSIKDTTAVSASPDYSIGDAVGGKRTMSNAYRVSGGTAVLEDIVLLDRANQGPGLTIYLFDSDPSAATITDNSAFVFSTDDLKVIAQISVSPSDWITTNSKKIAHLRGLGALLKGSGTTSLYAAIVATTAYNAAATDDLQVIYKLLQD